MKFKSLKYCLNSDKKLKPNFLKNNVPHNELLDDMELINDEDLFNFIQENDISRLVEKNLSLEDKIFESKLHYIIFQVEKEINIKRWKCLLNDKNAPYDMDKFKKLDIVLHKSGLISFYDFTKIAFSKGFRICQFKDTGSNSLLFNALLQISKCSNFDPQVRLDPLVFTEDKIDVEFKKMHGPVINWEILSNLYDWEVKQSDYKSDNIKTQIKWSKQENELIYECEEIPLKFNSDILATRYFHASYDLNNGRISHCDGSLNIYDTENYLQRMGVSLKDSNSHNSLNHIKIFLVRDVSKEGFNILHNTFFYENSDIEIIIRELNNYNNSSFQNNI